MSTLDLFKEKCCSCLGQTCFITEASHYRVHHLYHGGALAAGEGSLD